MTFSIILLLFVAGVAYFHFVQGFFSATLSAILTVLSAVIAVSYADVVVQSVFQGKFGGDSATAIAMVLLFAVSYFILRLIFDNAVPGNVRFQSTVDQVGAAVMGIVAGIFAAGIFSIAAQSLPFGPALLGFSPYDLSGTQSVIVPGKQQYLDSVVYNQMKDASLDPQKEKSPLLPVGDIVLAATERLSDGGSLAGDEPLSSVHPDMLQEEFGDRIGIQTGAKRTAINAPNAPPQIKVDSLFNVSQLPAVDGEIKELRGGVATPPRIVQPTAGQVLLVVRINVSHDAGDDEDHIFRFSTGSIRLVANSKDNYPIGIVEQIEGESVLMLQHPDDFLFLDTSGGSAVIDAAFLLDKNDVFSDAKTADKLADGVLLVVKRLAYVDLSGKPVASGYSPSSDEKVLRKSSLLQQIQKNPPPAVSVQQASLPAATPSAGAAGGGSSPSHHHHNAPTAGASEAGASLTSKVDATIPYKIGVNATDENAQNVAVAGGSVSLKDSRIVFARIDPTESLDKLAAGDSQLNELYVPDGKKLVQISGASGTPTVATLSDAKGASIPASGYFATVNGKLLLRYDAQHPLEAGSLSGGNAQTYLFIVPDNTQITQFSGGSRGGALNLNVP